MSKTKIEWTEVTWNPVLGCSKVSEGCRNCYAMTMSSRIANAAREKKNPSPVEKGYMKVVPQDKDGKFLPKWNNKIALIEERLEDPLRWQKPRMVFVNSMSDLFHPDVPFEFVAAVFGIMAYCNDHTFQVLTKRPDRMAEFFNWIQKGTMKVQGGDPLDYDEPQKCIQFAISKLECKETLLMGLTNAAGRDWPLKNIWLGTSCENQETADERIPHLLNCPAAVRFLSCEPLLGPVDLNESWHRMPSGGKSLWQLRNHSDDLHQVIVGGESGHHARPMRPDWVRQIRDDCIEADVAFFFKQWGAFLPDGQEDSMSEDAWMGIDSEGIQPMMCGIPNYRGWKMPKKHTGRLLDGREYNQIPEVQS